MTDTCISLVHEKEAFSLIEKLVDCALNDSVPSPHLDLPDPKLSDEFIYNLLRDDDTLTMIRTHYLRWPKELKIKLLHNYDDMFEIEVLNLIEAYTTTQIEYKSLDDLIDQYSQNDFIQLLQTSSYLAHRFICILSDYIIQFQNWKLVKLGQCMNRCLRTQLFELCRREIDNATFQHVETHDIHNVISSYIFGNGPNTHIENRRNEAWCLVLSFTRFTWYCIYRLVQWKENGDKIWSSQVHMKKKWEPNNWGINNMILMVFSQMEDILVYVNWITYPAMNNGESESLSYFRNWIQTSQST